MTTEATANPDPTAPAADAAAQPAEAPTPAVGGKRKREGEKGEGKAAREKGEGKAAAGREKGKRRGPPRPHRRLEEGVLSTRMERLEARIEKAREQIEDAGRHLEIYALESKYRRQDAAAEAAELDALERRQRAKEPAGEAAARAEEAA